MFIRTGAFIRINVVSYKTNLFFFFFFFFFFLCVCVCVWGGYNMNLDFLFVLEEKTHCLITIFFF